MFAAAAAAASSFSSYKAAYACVTCLSRPKGARKGQNGTDDRICIQYTKGLHCTIRSHVNFRFLVSDSVVDKVNCYS